MQIKTTHIGEDYALIEVDGEEFQVPRGLGEKIQSEIEIDYYSHIDFPQLGSVFERDGLTYKVTDNSRRNVITAVLIEDQP